MDEIIGFERDGEASDETVARLAALAHSAFGEKTVSVDGNRIVFTFGATDVTVAVHAEAPDEVWMRAHVADLDKLEDAGALAEEALRANLFWQGTAGATLSLDPDGKALYLSERIAAARVVDAESLAACLDDFTDALADWRLRVRSHLGGVDALPASADFAAAPAEGETEGNGETVADGDAGMEIFR